MNARDQRTADAFASSWNNLPGGSVYTEAQVLDWFEPLRPEDLRGQRVLELGCGNGSLAVHVLRWGPASLDAVDLGASVDSARRNLASTGLGGWHVIQGDLTTFQSSGYDVVYSIGVLHHLQEPRAGFESVLRNTRAGGRFHCWVYAREGNGLVIAIVEPVRRIASKLPWWVAKYGVALPLVLPFFVYAKLISALPAWRRLQALPLYHYSRWIAKRDLAFFRHVAFDQIVTPRTVYLDRNTIDTWLGAHAEVEPGSTYVAMRNGNSWKFGGRRRT